MLPAIPIYVGIRAWRLRPVEANLGRRCFISLSHGFAGLHTLHKMLGERPRLPSLAMPLSLAKTWWQVVQRTDPPMCIAPPDEDTPARMIFV